MNISLLLCISVTFFLFKAPQSTDKIILLQRIWDQWHCFRQTLQLWPSRNVAEVTVFPSYTFLGKRKETLMNIIQEKNPGMNLLCVMHNSRNSLRKSYDVT